MVTQSWRSGFTLFELLVVLVLMGLVTTAAVPLIDRALPNARLWSTARELATALSRTRDAALFRNRETVLTLDLETRRYGAPALDIKGRLSEQIDIGLETAQDEVIAPRRAGIRFYPDGGSTGGRLILRTGAQSYAVSVDWLTGRIAVSR